MKHRLTSLAIIILPAILLAIPASAQNIGFLTRGPIAYLNDDEKALLSETLNRALDTGADGETLTWEYPDTGNNGRIELLDTHEDFGTTCRTIRTHTTALGREGGGIYRLCRANDDSWRFAPPRRGDQPR